MPKKYPPTPEYIKHEARLACDRIGWSSTWASAIADSMWIAICKDRDVVIKGLDTRCARDIFVERLQKGQDPGEVVDILLDEIVMTVKDHPWPRTSKTSRSIAGK